MHARFGVGFLILLCPMFRTPVPAAEAASRFPVPKADAPARRVVIVDWLPRGLEDRTADLAVRTLQGMVNRRAERPFVWVGTNPRTGSEGWWFDRFAEMGLLDPDSERIPPEEFFDRYAKEARGVVIPPEVRGGYHLALAVSAVEDLIVASPAEIERWDLPAGRRIDLRSGTLGLRTYRDCLKMALDDYVRPGKIGRAGLCYLRDDLVASGFLADLIVYRRLFPFTWHLDASDGEREVLEEIFDLLPDNLPVLGFVGGSVKAGFESEGHLIALCSRYGKFSLGCGGTPNLTIQSGWDPPVFPEPAPVGPVEARRDRIYVMVRMSDGDNANTYRTHIPRREVWERRGGVPIGWSVGGCVPDLLPGVMRYYVEKEPPAPGDEFLLGLSGLGYTWPGEFARSLPPERAERAWKEFLDLTVRARLRMRAGLICIHHYEERDDWRIGPEIWSRYIENERPPRALLSGYNRIAPEYGRTYSLCRGVPVFHVAVDRQWGDPDLARTIREAAGSRRPAFIQLFWIPHIVDMEWGIESLKALPEEEFTVVSPGRFVDLFEDALRKGWIEDPLRDSGNSAGRADESPGEKGR